MSFDRVLGQKEAKKILGDELDSGRISHAYLFVGKKGLGKKEMAYEFVKALLCGSEGLEGCGDCIICRKIEHNNHADVRLLTLEEESSSIKISQIREMQKELVYKPYESEQKVYIIDHADQMTPQAANSLLRTLEEPPDYAVLILLAEEINQLLPTIISRCQQIFFYNVESEKISQKLQQEGSPPQKADLYSRLADGSPGQARELKEDADFLEKRNRILDFVSDLPHKKRVEIFSEAEQIKKMLDEGFPLFNLISGWYRDIILYIEGQKNQIVNVDYMSDIKEKKEQYTAAEINNFLEDIQKTKEDVKRNVNKELALDVLFIRLCSGR